MDKSCPVCGVARDTDGWCDECIDRTLAEQKREDSPRIRPQIFHS